MTVTADSILQGHRVSVVLEPDPNLELYHEALPAYVESYPLPHLSAIGEDVWGATRRGHALLMEDRIASHLGFVYTNALPLYLIYVAIDDPSDARSTQVQIKINSAHQYAALNLVPLPVSKQVWHSASASELDVLAQSVRNGNPHRIVWREKSGLVRAHPLDLAFLFAETGDVSFRVEASILPSVMQDPNGFKTRCQTAIPDFENKVRDQSFVQPGKLASINSFRLLGTDSKISGGGNFFNRISEFEEVVIFAD